MALYKIPSASLSRVTGLVLLLLVAAFSVYAFDLWSKTKEREEQQMRSSLLLIANALDTYFVSKQAGLLSLADTLEQLPEGLHDVRAIQQLLTRYQSHRPEIRQAILTDLSGQILATSSTSDLSGLPTVTDEASYQDFLHELPGLQGMHLGRQQVDKLTGSWNFSLRVVVRDKHGMAIAVLSDVLPAEDLASLWKDATFVSQMTVGLLRDDGFLMTRYPLRETAPRQEVFGKPRDGGIIQHLRSEGFPKEGTLIGPNGISNGADYVNVYRRLANFPVTAFITQPQQLVVVTWTHGISTPAFILAALLLIISLFSAKLQEHSQSMEAQRSASEDKLRANEAEQRFLIDNLMAGVVVHDAKGAVLRCNGEASRLLGLTFEQMTGKALIDPAWQFLEEDGSIMPIAHYPAAQVIAHDEAIVDVVAGIRRAAGEEISWVLCRADPWRGPEGTLERVVVTFIEITDRIYAQAQLAEIAHFDALTHLPNRVLLADRLRQAITHATRLNRSVAVAFLDIDGFKEINDRYGHSVGDQFLVSMASRLNGVLREGDTFSRFGGDEFVAVMPDLGDENDADPLLRRLLHSAAESVHVGDLVLKVSASIGVTIFPRDGSDADQLLRHADQAMYQAKQSGKNRFHLFDVVSDTNMRQRQQSLDEIALGLQRHEFVLYYQPQVNMVTGAVIGVEALIRWQHPQKGLLPPGLFIPLVEDQDLALVMGEQVLDMALRQIEQWQQMDIHLQVSVNVFPRQLQEARLIEKMQDLLDKYADVSPEMLELEIVESSALADIELVSKLMAACRQLGITFALDDFGTGYSSLTYLKKLPAERLKIDQTFVRDMLMDPNDLAIVKGVIGLAAAFNRHVIAEGVETVAQGLQLVSMGCDFAQGYGIARPMPAHELPGWLQAWQAQQPWLAIDRP